MTLEIRKRYVFGLQLPCTIVSLWAPAFKRLLLCVLDLCQKSKYNFIKSILRAPQNRTAAVNITLDKAKLKALRSYELVVHAVRHQSHEKETEVW